MKKQILSEELNRMYKLAGLISENYVNFILLGTITSENGNEWEVKQKVEDDSWYIVRKEDRKVLPFAAEELASKWAFKTYRNEIEQKINDSEKDINENELEESDTKKVIDLSKYDSHTLDQLRQKFARTYGDMPSDEELKNIISAMPELNKESALEESELLKEETIEDFFEFLGRNPSKSSMATVMYTNPVKVNKFIIDDLGNKVPNPMFDKLFKNTRFMFRWQDTYNRAVERNNPEHELGKRSGTFEKVEGVDVLERGKSGLYLPIIPTGSESAYSVYENGKFSPISKEEARKYMPEYKEREGGSGVDFRPLIVDRIYKINAGGNNWINPNFQYEYLGPERMAEDVMIQEGQLGRTITKMLIEEILK